MQIKQFFFVEVRGQFEKKSYEIPRLIYANSYVN